MKILEARNVTKIFPGVVALDAINVSFELGKVHCIVGENGAGKSTLIKCLTGVYEPDDGEILIEGKPALKDKKLFEKVAYVPQEIDLFNHMTVAENLFIPFDRSNIKGAISQKMLRERAIPIIEKFNIGVLPDTLVRGISVSQQQLLQIARATVFEGYDVLLLDEPTTSLTTEDTERLFQTIEQLKKENKSIVFISHKLEEVFAIGDVTTVFRNGKQVAEVNTAEIDVTWTVTQMTGHALDENEVFYSDKVTDETLLSVKHLTGEQFRDVSFDLKKGEILGFSGLVGAGRSELMQAVFGYLPAVSGEVTFRGEPWKLGDTSYSVKKGMFYLPEERRSQGILPELSIRENTSINLLSELLVGGLVSKKKETALINDVVADYDVKAPNISKQIKFLSGGNQQKVVIARAMSCKPSVLIFDEPTKGIDVGTKTEIYRMMKKIAEEEGIGIILISSEMNEVRRCSNRIITLYKGKKAGEFDKNADTKEILHSILGLNEAKAGEKEHE
ncbi:MAG: sugar ABC transporter ATP-binding protein [Christensenella sp.]|uniref:sugar ABC transporter ATP-binding protein n=1 Tax=Christensenella sp. TaxID=1935934 RepID=UPI002B213EE6|nr:sugar ABC transporter ATP-binding protein [Christensenella sp.]MEA5002104.1 sugar ABC transporter ATP-binding protein [Christensenella sp.]